MKKLKIGFRLCALMALAGLAGPSFGQSADLQTSKLSVLEQNVPDHGGDQQSFSIITPNGKLILQTNADNGSISYETVAGDQSPQNLWLGEPSPLSFYGMEVTAGSETAEAFHDGNTFFVPIEASPGGMCNAGSNVYVVKWEAGGVPLLSALASLDDCIDADIVRPSHSGLAISILSGDDLKIVNWWYDPATNSLTNQASVYYHAPPDFTPLISKQDPAVKSVETRFGTLTLDPNSGILLNGIVQNFPGSPAHDYWGFASKVFQDGDKDVVIALAEPDMATGLTFQVLVIDGSTIKVSQYFGTGFSYISYQSKGGYTLFDVGQYSPTPAAITGEPSFSEQHFQLSDDTLRGVDPQDRIIPSTEFPMDIPVKLDTGPSYQQTVQFIQNRKANTDFKEVIHCKFSYIDPGLANAYPSSEEIVDFSQVASNFVLRNGEIQLFCQTNLACLINPARPDVTGVTNDSLILDDPYQIVSAFERLQSLCQGGGEHRPDDNLFAPQSP